MAGQLQVRQSITVSGRRIGGSDEPIAECITHGRWVDVQSPNWLQTFVMPHDGFVYEFRHAPEEGEG